MASIHLPLNPSNLNTSTISPKNEFNQITSFPTVAKLPCLQSKILSNKAFRISKNFVSFSKTSSSRLKVKASSSKSVTELVSSDGNSETEIFVKEKTDAKSVSNGEVSDKKDKKSFFWKKAKEIAKSGNIIEAKVEAINSGGLIIFFGTLRCFLPFSQIDPARLYSESEKNISEIAEALIGKSISCKIIDINEKESRIIMSEKTASLQKRLEQIIEGDIYEGIIASMTDFGIFVDILLPDGSFPVTGLIHVSEISWDPINDFQNLFQIKDKLKVKVINVDRMRERIALSIKQLKNDPLYETLDNILPLNDVDDDNENNNGDWISTLDGRNDEENENFLNSQMQGLDNICKELLNENGVFEVKVGRKGIEQKVVSQDLELWMSNVVGEDGAYTILARAGRQVQEIYVTANLNREEMKNALKIVTSRIV